MIVNVRLIYMSTDHKGMIALGKTLGKFYAQPVRFFRGNLAGTEGLAHMIGNHIICAAHSSGSGNVLPLCQKELCIRSPAVTRIAGNESAVICFLWVGHIVDDVADRPTFCAALADMKRHDSCGCHRSDLLPEKKTVTQAEPPKVNLLVDIQAKLQTGKGAGYARWAKVFNLKQMAQTMNYLSENNLLEYAVLEEKAAAATAHHNELSAQIKAAEKRMAEIAVLRTHIVNYAKTREVYVAYRKAGYSKKFREEHEKEILLHQAAKNAFDEMGVKKLPKVKELQTEYTKLLEEKKKTYAEYRRSREEMRELLTAKANVDRVLKMEVEQDVEKEKDHGQR